MAILPACIAFSIFRSLKNEMLNAAWYASQQPVVSVTCFTSIAFVKYSMLFKNDRLPSALNVTVISVLHFLDSVCILVQTSLSSLMKASCINGTVSFIRSKSRISRKSHARRFKGVAHFNVS